MDNKKVMKLAGNGKRFFAAVIDRVPVFIISYIIVIDTVEQLVNMMSNQFPFGGYGYGMSYTQSPFITYLGLVRWVIFFVQVFFWSRGQSIGKAILGLRVVDNKRGEKLGFGSMLIRELFAKTGSNLVFYLGNIWVLIDKQNRAWHDKIIDSYVVDERATAAAIAMQQSAQSVSAAVNQGMSAINSNADGFSAAYTNRTQGAYNPSNGVANPEPAPVMVNNDPDPNNPFTRHFVDSEPTPVQEPAPVQEPTPTQEPTPIMEAEPVEEVAPAVSEPVLEEPKLEVAEPVVEETSVDVEEFNRDFNSEFEQMKKEAEEDFVSETIDTGFELKDAEPLVDEEIFTMEEKIEEPETISSSDEYFVRSEKTLEEQLAALGLEMPDKSE